LGRASINPCASSRCSACCTVAFGTGTIDLNEHNSTWLPYRVCGIDIRQPINELQFLFEGGGVKAGKETTFLTSGRP